MRLPRGPNASWIERADYLVEMGIDLGDGSSALCSLYFVDRRCMPSLRKAKSACASYRRGAVIKDL